MNNKKTIREKLLERETDELERLKTADYFPEEEKSHRVNFYKTLRQQQTIEEEHKKRLIQTIMNNKTLLIEILNGYDMGELSKMLFLAMTADSTCPSPNNNEEKHDQ